MRSQLQQNLTQLSGGHPGSAEYEQLCEQFSEAERVNLTLAIATINAWNRFGAASICNRRDDCRIRV
ncbi:hypothetical protein NAV33_00395 [Pseudomonas stutzeri]|uniref:hypothetical protein n=1 Tax=Stutzerimonas stutzeri TaxID=316 RepID=UPI00210A812B|nr:hypothetical protein [Stutzerimonas stutzeri]MCQ4310362.1 hypothetical protein [Stutzerimonas stutzeri]